jgi:hypothetical protein
MRRRRERVFTKRHEVRQGGEQRLDVAAPRQVERSGERLEARSRNQRGHLDAELEGDGAVVAPVQHERRRAHPLERLPRLGPIDALEQSRGHLQRGGVALEAREPAQVLGVAVRQEDAPEQARANPPVAPDDRHNGFTGPVVGDAWAVRKGAVQDEPLYAARMFGRIGGREAASGREADSEQRSSRRWSISMPSTPASASSDSGPPLRTDRPVPMRS